MYGASPRNLCAFFKEHLIKKNLTFSGGKPPENPDYGKCPDGEWTAVEGPKCFYVSNADSTSTKTFFDAQSDCENRGGNLAGITDKAENERIFAEASSTF